MPVEEEQEALLEALAALVAARGHLPLVSSHLLEPSPRYFPDAWRADADGVANVARRLLDYAGLGLLDVEMVVDARVEVVDGRVESTVGGTSRSWRHTGAAGWFMGIRDGRCSFGIDVGKLGDPEGLVATMCHEVAHAYRRVHGLEVDDRDAEELLTDVTTVFLGFGILTANGSYRFRQSGELQGAMTVTRWSHDRAGYLSPDAMSFLLAVCVTARRLEGSKVRRIERLLEPNQAGSFHAAMKRLRRPDAQLERTLGLPPSPRWPDPPPLAQLGAARSLPEAEEHPVPAPARRTSNAGRPVFRVRQGRALSYGNAGFWAGLLAGAGLWGAGLDATVIPLTAGGLAFAGAVVGMRKLRFICSDPNCRENLGATAYICPGCGGEVSGEIAREIDRLDAEERLRRRQGAE